MFSSGIPPAEGGRNGYLLGITPHPASQLTLDEEIDLIRQELAKVPSPYSLEERELLEARLVRRREERETILHGG